MMAETRIHLEKEKEKKWLDDMWQKYLSSIKTELCRETNFPALIAQTSYKVPMAIPAVLFGAHKRPVSLKMNLLRNPPHKAVKSGTNTPSLTPAGGNAGDSAIGKAGKAMGSAKKSLPFQPKKAVPPGQPVYHVSPDYMHSLYLEKSKMMIDLDAILDAQLPDKYAEGILGFLSALSQYKLYDTASILADSLFVTISKYFPQDKTGEKSQ